MKEEKRAQIMQKTAVVWFGALVCCALWEVRFHALRSAIRCLKLMPLIPQHRFYLQGIVLP